MDRHTEGRLKVRQHTHTHVHICNIQYTVYTYYHIYTHAPKKEGEAE